MTVKIDIDKYTGNSPLISKMLHMADQGKLGEAENNNGMLDTEKEADRFLKLAEKNKDLLAKHGYKVEGGGGIFTITRTNSNYDAKDYNSVLTYDLKHDIINEVVSADGLSAKTVFDNNDEKSITLYETGDESHVFDKVKNNEKISNIFLVLHNIFTLGGVSKRFNIMNSLSNY